MGKVSRRKSASSLKNLDPVNPFLLADGRVVTQEMAQGIVGTEFVFQNARRIADDMADASPVPELREFFRDLADGLLAAERMLRPATDKALDALGLPRNHALRSDVEALSQDILPGAVVQTSLGRFVIDELSAPASVLRASDGSRVEVGADGIVQHSAPDHVLAEVGLPPSR